MEAGAVRDIAALVVPRVGRVVESADGQGPFRVVDAAGQEVSAVSDFLREMAACDASPATLRSYTLLCRARHNIPPGYTVNRSGSGSCISVVRQGRFAAGRSRLGGWPLPRVAGALPRGFLLVRMSAYRIGSCPAASSITR